jgi:hypothetical protein
MMEFWQALLSYAIIIFAMLGAFVAGLLICDAATRLWRRICKRHRKPPPSKPVTHAKNT